MDLALISIIINLILLGLLVYVILVWLLPPFLGAPFVPTKGSIVNSMIKLARVLPGEKAIDLGSGDGRLVMALAHAGAEAHGYEINPLLVIISRLNIRRAGLRGRAFVHWRSFWRKDYSSFNIITIYGLIGIMKKLEPKLLSQLPAGARVVSHTFKFPNWPPSRQENGAYLYEKIILP